MNRSIRTSVVVASAAALVAVSAAPARAASPLAVTAAVASGPWTPGGTVAVDVLVRNAGDATVTNVSATVATSEEGVSVPSATAAYGDLAPGDETARPVEIAAGAGVACGRDITFTVALASDQGPAEGAFTVALACPRAILDVASIHVDDASGGNGDGYLQPGESASLVLELVNEGTQTLTGMIGALTLEGMTVGAHAAIPDVPPGKMIRSEPFSVTVHDDADVVRFGSDQATCFATTGGDEESLEPVSLPDVAAPIRGLLSVESDQGAISTRVLMDFTCVMHALTAAPAGGLVERAAVTASATDAPSEVLAQTGAARSDRPERVAIAALGFLAAGMALDRAGRRRGRHARA